MPQNPWIVTPGERCRLAKRDPSDTGRYRSKEEAEERIAANLQKLTSLQDRLSAEARRAVLVVLQGMDTSGKDGTITHVMGAFNPQAVQVTAFKQPTAEELAHDPLWRIHRAVPPKGVIGIFNRSHYEDVLVVRVHELVSKDIWSPRYEHINAFEKMLDDEGVEVVKLFLHIDRKEQAKRLRARVKDPTKNWKFQPGDLKERALWNRYREAYEDALSRCSTERAPWYVIPANHKWFRNLAVSEVLRQRMEALHLHYPPPPKDLARYSIR